eukprot:686899-Hanusia_phi.AAC.13
MVYPPFAMIHPHPSFITQTYRCWCALETQGDSMLDFAMYSAACVGGGEGGRGREGGWYLMGIRTGGTQRGYEAVTLEDDGEGM